ncbi:MAG: transketolase [Alloprevotella sp.]|nr:transketolase [Alloprevotella sp.]
MKHDKPLMERAADNIRILAAAMVERARSGHPGGAMGGADFINVLFSEFLTADPDNPGWHFRDRFFLDPGHMSPMLYAQLALAGKFTLAELQAFRQWGSPTPGHPERCVERGIENTSGPLGQGHVFAVGAAIAAKALYARTGHPGFRREKIYAYISDGGVQEEISQGAGRMAGHLGLDNLVMFYDANDIQLSTPTSAVTGEDTRRKYEAWNWRVLEIDGNDADQIRQALRAAKDETERPTLIIGRTVMGKGARKADGSSYEATTKTHGAPLGAGNFEETVRNLGGNPDAPFSIFPEVEEMYAARHDELRTEVGELRQEYADWEARHPQESARIADWMAGRQPELPWESVQLKPGSATRAASSAVLEMLAQHVPNMIVSSADLCNSDKTDGFLKHSAAITATDFSGGFLQAGVSELTMACLCIGIVLHGGMHAACGTFFVFSDYMKPAVRMAALMQTPVKFVWTHDAFRVGEDGPTHEPVEQEAQIRLMEKLQNHCGQDSLRVFRPADARETTACWRLAMENTDTPTALVFTRQDVDDLPEGADRTQCARGAYEALPESAPDVTLVASGSEAGTLCRAAELLRTEGIAARVVSCPSEGLFRRQPVDYQTALIPPATPVFGLTAGLPVTLQGLVGPQGRVFGLESFGYSAPYKVLEEKLGFTPEKVAAEVREYLGR